MADAAIRNDPEFLPNVTELWNGTRSKPQIRRDLMNALRDKGRVVDDKYEDAVERNLDRAHAVSDYRFPTVDIRKTAAKQAEEASKRRRPPRRMSPRSSSVSTIRVRVSAKPISS